MISTSCDACCLKAGTNPAKRICRRIGFRAAIRPIVTKRRTERSLTAGGDRTGAALSLLVFSLLAGCARPAGDAALAGDPDAGAAAIVRQACGSCHNLPGIQDANGRVGPSLAHFGLQRLIAGQLPNRPDTLRRFLADPQAVAPGIAMPNQGLTESEIRDIAAYLEAQK